LVAPLVAPIDNRLLARGLASDEVRWVTPSRLPGPVLSDRDASFEELLDLVPKFLEPFALRPNWSQDELRLILTDAAAKRDIGAPVSRIVSSPNGMPVGLFLYHVRRGHVAIVTQILAAKGREGAVLDRAILHAVSMGAVAIRGRAYPSLMPALTERRVVLLPELASVAFTRNPDILSHLRQGTAFFTGLAGEQWMRLNGDSF
jgi:hypothetical protein